MKKLQCYFLLALVSLTSINAREAIKYSGYTHCQRECPPATSALQWRQNYYFESVDALYNHDERKVNLTSKIYVTFTNHSDCLWSVKISAADVANYPGQYSPDLLKVYNDLPVYFNPRGENGAAKSICVHTNDNGNAIHFKETLISTYSRVFKTERVKSETKQEKDIFGNCETSFNVLHENETSYAYRVTKNLSTCKNRFRYHLYRGIPFLPVNPFTNEHQDCVYNIEEGLLALVQCTERFTLNTFKASSDIQSRSSVRLELLSTERGQSGLESSLEDQSGSFLSSKPILPPAISRDNNETDIPLQVSAVLKVLCEEIGSELPRVRVLALIKQLGVDLKRLNLEQLNKIDDGIVELKYCKWSHMMRIFFLNSLIEAGSFDAILKLRNETLVLKERGVFEDNWITHLKNISEASLYALMTLLDDTVDRYLHTLRAFASQVRQFCDRATHCETTGIYQTVLAYLYEPLGDKCFAENEKSAKIIRLHLEILAELEMVGNGLPVLQRCVTDALNGSWAQLTAMASLTSMPCDQVLEAMVTIYTNKSFPQSIKDMALSKLEECKSSDYAIQVHDIFDSLHFHKGKQLDSSAGNLSGVFEPTNGSVEWKSFRGKDHKRNEKLAPVLLGLEHFLEGWGLHLNVEQFNFPNSSLPRSLKLILLSDYLKKNPEILKIGFEFENIEALVSSVFEKVGFGQMPADVKKLLAKFHSKNENGAKGSVDFYLQLFKRIIFSEKFEGPGFLPTLKALKETISKLSGVHDDNDYYANRWVMTNITVYRPTITGRSLEVRVNANALIKAEYGGVIDAQNLFSKSRNGFIEGYVTPTVMVTAALEVNLIASRPETGIRLLVEFRASERFDGTLNVTNGLLTHAKLNFPSDREIFNLRYSLLSPVDSSKEHWRKSIQIPYWLKNLGIQYELVSNTESHSDPYGERVLTMKRQLVDPIMKGYEVKIERASIEEGDTTWKVLFDTPGSLEPGLIEFHGIIRSKSSNETSFVLETNSTAFKASLESSLISKTKLKQFSVQLIVNDSLEMDFLAYSTVDKSPGRTIFKPYLVFATPLLTKSPLDLAGEISVSSGEKKKLDFDLYSEYFFIPNPRIKGNMAIAGSILGSLRLSSTTEILLPQLSLQYHLKASKSAGRIFVGYNSNVTSLHDGVMSSQKEVDLEILNQPTAQTKKGLLTARLHREARNETDNATLNWEIGYQPHRELATKVSLYSQNSIPIWFSQKIGIDASNEYYSRTNCSIPELNDKRSSVINWDLLMAPFSFYQTRIKKLLW